MKPRINVITLGVRDLDRALRFYRDGLGWPTPGIVGTEFPDGAVVFIPLSHGQILALFPKDSLAKDARVVTDEPGFPQFSLGYNVNTRDDVDTVMEQARAAGARITREPQDQAWGGYSGYFQDPDGHLWDVVWNPQLLVEEE